MRARLLHVLNGDCTRIILEQTGIPGESVVWADVLHEGPAPYGVSEDEWLELRGGSASDRDPAGAKFLADIRRANATLARYAEFDEVVFWFEHDLFDQLLLIRHLDWIASGARDLSKFRLICIGAFPGHARFAGLGELAPDELASLFPHRRPVSEAEVTLGGTLWRAFGAPDPLPLARLVLETDTSLLPFVAGALHRHLEDFPASASGLSRSERQILSVVSEGHEDAVDAFRATARLEERVFMGDLTFFGIMKQLAAGRVPLLMHDGEWRSGAPPGGRFRLTEAGRRVLAGDADYIALNGIDRWMGGVHLTDGTYRWTGKALTRDSR